MILKPLFRKKSIEAIQADIAAGAGENHGLAKNLRTRDLVAFGIAAIIGAGIFSTVGNAAHAGGPAVVLLFLFTAVACTFAGLAYAEFASMIPISGSAYTYSYAVFGELVAWIIGWDLIIEYAIGNVAVAVSWSDYFTALLNSIDIPALGIHGIHIPDWLTMDYFSAKNGAEAYFTNPSPDLETKLSAWQCAPQIFGLRFICDLPALGITALITWVIYRGVRESKRANNIMVILKLVILLIVLSVGAFYINPCNWDPFAPNGIGGVFKGVAAVFFAYIGFDAISTTAEECKDPQRDMPRGILWSIAISTVIYVVITLVLTGMMSYENLNVGDPLALVFENTNVSWMVGLVSVGAVIAVASVLLVFQMGQPRIWMSMSRDGLLPKVFSRIHPRFKTPSFSTVMTGFMVGIPALFLNLNQIVELASIGTLFAFVLVCGGVLVIQAMKNPPPRKFKTPYINAKYITPLLFAGAIAGLIIEKNYLMHFFTICEGESAWHNVPMFLFFIAFAVLAVLSFIYNLSLLPLLGMLCSLFMMALLPWTNWTRFGLWLLAGLVIYFAYSFRNSRLAPKNMDKS